MPVYVRVLDVNDNAPTFATNYETFVCENAKANQVGVVPRRLLCFCIYSNPETDQRLTVGSSVSVSLVKFHLTLGSEPNVFIQTLVGIHRNCDDPSVGSTIYSVLCAATLTHSNLFHVNKRCRLESRPGEATF